MSYASVITLQGIEEAIQGLGYKQGSALKYRLVAVIRGLYGEHGESMDAAQGLSTEDLIRSLWEVDEDPESVRSKKKNLSSLKSLVNADLKRLYLEGKNPEGIVIGPENLFTISDEAKAGLEMLTKVLVGSGFSGADRPGGAGCGLNQIRDLVNELLKRVGLPWAGAQEEGPATGGPRPEAEKAEDWVVEEAPVGDDPGAIVDELELVEDLPDTEVLEAEEIDEGPLEAVDDLSVEEFSAEEDLIELPVMDGGVVDALEEDDEEILEVQEVEVEEIDEGPLEAVDDLSVEEFSAEEDLIELPVMDGGVVDALEEDDEEILEVQDVEVEEVDEEQIEDGDDLIIEEAAEEDAPSAGTAVPSDGEYMPAAGASMEELSWAEADEKKKARILAEKFSGSLSEMDRFYNRYILIAAGDYAIGSDNGVSARRRVPITQFHMGKFPITNGLFDVFVEKTGYVTTAEKVGYGTVYSGRFQKRVDEKTGGKSILWSCSLTSKVVPGAFWYRPFGPGSTLHHKRNHPVVQVSLEDCMAFAAWAGKRLPTEEEWEAAARTMNGHLYPWGNRFRRNACNFEKSAHGETTPVDLYLKHENKYGIADALGNVLEWTATRIDRPEGEIERDTVYFITKGGCWITDKAVDLTGRTEMRSDAHSNILGFRCVAY